MNSRYQRRDSFEDLAREANNDLSATKLSQSSKSPEVDFTFDKYAYRQEPLRSSTESEDEYKPICRPKIHSRAQSPICSREALRQIRRRKLLGSETKQNALSGHEKLQGVSGNKNASGKSASKEAAKVKPKREPLPMCRRALPHSFFKEPESMNTSSLAGDFYPVLPPLFPLENEDVAEMRPVTPPQDRGRVQPPKKVCKPTEPDTELLFSLFSHLEEPFDKRLLVRRGRPKKHVVEKPVAPPIPKENDDPCVVDALSERMFPKLSLNSNQSNSSGEGPIPIGVIRLNNSSRAIEFPAIASEQNYSALLNELVTRM